MKGNVKKILEFIVFISTASLPFIMATNVLGIDAFLDSFENPESYTYIKKSDSISGIVTNQEKYIIIQKSGHPHFEVKETDTVLYFNFEGCLTCNEIIEINGVGTFARYYIEEDNDSEKLVFNNQIVGKVIKVLDDNIISDLSLKIWEISIGNLNIESIM